MGPKHIRSLRHLVMLSAVALSGFSCLTAASATTAEGFFRTPSGNIICEYLVGARVPPELTCYRLEPKFMGIYRGPSGKPIVFEPQEGDFGDIESWEVLEYGKRWSGEGLTCSSTEAGLSCERDNPRNGFFLSRDHVKTY